MRLIEKIETKYNTKARYQSGWSYKKRNGLTKSGGNCFYFVDPKIEAIYERASRISAVKRKAQNERERAELSSASKNNDFEAFVSALVKTTCTIKRKHIKKFADANNLNFEIVRFGDNSNWSFVLDGVQYQVYFSTLFI